MKLLYDQYKFFFSQLCLLQLIFMPNAKSDAKFRRNGKTNKFLIELYVRVRLIIYLANYNMEGWN